MIRFIYSKERFTEKPKGRLITLLQQPEAYTFTQVSVGQMANLIEEGRAWRAGIYAPSTASFKKQNAQSAQVIALDFDKVSFTPEAVIEYATSIGLTPSILYYTYSQGIKEGYNFRLLWVLAEEITPIQYENVYPNLQNAFEEYTPDRATKDCSRLWFGSNREVEVISEEPISLSSLGWLAVLERSKEDGLTSAYTLRKQKKNFGENYFAQEAPEAVSVGNGWFERLRVRCWLWDKWEKGEYLNYNQRLTLFTNIKYLNYGDRNKSIIQDVLDFYNPTTYAGHTCDEGQIRQMLMNRTLLPNPIVLLDNDLITVPDFFKAGTVEMEIYNTAEKITLEELDEKLDNIIPEQLEAKGISYVEAQTACGKTERIIRWLLSQDLSKKKIIYSAPTYNMIGDFEERFEWNYHKQQRARQGNSTNGTISENATPAFGAEEARNLDNYLNVEAKPPIYIVPKGNYTAQDLLRFELGLPAKTPQNERYRAIRALMDYEEKGVFVCSHQLIAHLRELNADLIIIDENIEEALQDVIQFDLKGLAGIMPFVAKDEDRQAILNLIDRVKQKKWGQTVNIEVLREIIADGERFDIEEYISTGAVMAGLAKITETLTPAKISQVGESNSIRLSTVSTLITRALAKQVPLKLFTATPKAYTLLSLYGIDPKTVGLYSFPMAENRGQIIQYLGMTGAKGRNNERIPELIAYVKKKLPPEELDKAFVLSFKDSIPLWREAGFNIPEGRDGTALHLANNAGLDLLKGKTVIVAGKYDLHDGFYYDKYCDLYPNREERPTRKNRALTINGITVKMFLWDDDMLRQIQLENIRQATEQSAGRARALREEGAKVYIFANYPIKDADLHIR